MSKRALIFDFGGVLMKTVNYAPRHRWDVHLGLAPGSVERVVHGIPSWIQAQLGQLPVADYWLDVAGHLGLTPAEVERLADEFYSGDQLDASLITYIRQQRGKDVPVALLSNDTPELSEKLSRLGIADLFDPLVISGYIGVMKPSHGAYKAVLDQLDYPASNTIFIDDNRANVDAARELGIQGVHYINGMNLPAVLASMIKT